MQSIRFIAAFAEILISPAILLYMAVGPIANPFHRHPSARPHSRAMHAL
jgi:hypothetical protein